LRHLKQDLLLHGLCSELVLDRLEESHVAEYLATEFADGSLPVDLAHLVHRRSGGNALFMVAIVEDLRKRGLIVQDRGRWALAAPLQAIDSTLVPETLQQMLQVQFEQLSAPEQRILGAACVAGERFSACAVAAMLDMPADEVEERCEELAKRLRFVRSAGIYGLPNGTESAHYEFRHSLYRDALYQGLSDVNRSKLHRRLGKQLKVLSGPGRTALASEIALHLEKGRAYEDAVHYLIRAAENAADRFAYRDSIRILEHALELLAQMDATGRAETEIQILELIGDAHYWLGAMRDCARAHEAQAARAAHEALKPAEVNALSCLVRPYGFIDPDRGIAAIERAVNISAGIADPVLHARSQMLAACTRLLYDTWRREDAERCAVANQTLRGLGIAGLPAYHEMLYGHVQSLAGNYDEALRIAETGVPGTNQPSNLMAFFFALSGKTVALLHSGRFGELQNVVRAGVAMAEKNGNVPWLFMLREAWLRTLVLDFSGAERLCDMLTHAGTENPTGQPEAIARFAAGYSELDGGHHDRALRYFQQICDPQITPKFFLHWHWRVRARIGLSDVWLASGDLGKARSAADHSVEAALASAEPNLHALAWDAAARVAMAEGDWESAADKLRKGLAVLEQFEIPATAWRVHATAWDWHRHAGNVEAAGTHRRRAEAILLQLAHSFEPDEPLRNSFLEAAPIRRIREAVAAR
jgi:tetratricopeptide (TPR) repeat protein